MEDPRNQRVEAGGEQRATAAGAERVEQAFGMRDYARNRRDRAKHRKLPAVSVGVWTPANFLVESVHARRETFGESSPVLPTRSPLDVQRRTDGALGTSDKL